MIFKGLSMKQIPQFFLEGESPTLILRFLNYALVVVALFNVVLLMLHCLMLHSLLLHYIMLHYVNVPLLDVVLYSESVIM